MSDIKLASAKDKPDWDKLNPKVEYIGRAITLPADPAKMPYGKAIAALQRLEKDDLQPFNVYEVFDAYPTDAAVAVVKAMIKLYGWASPESQQTFFGKRPPQMLSVKTGYSETDVVQVPLGQFRLPGVDDPITTGIYPGMGFVINGEIKKKDRHVVLELATEARRILKAESIYRGKAIRLSVDEDGDLETNKPPIFLNVTDMNEVDLIFDDEIMNQIHTNLLVPIKETQACRTHKIPLRRGILLEGPYGTGKSLTARLTARVCEQNGWTFVLLDKVKGLRHALEFALKYSPAVVFAEDIDRIIEQRTDGANDLINTIDGVGSKTSEIMTVLTTNFVEKIDRVILRPGRLDAVISLRPPEAEAVERLIRHYAGERLDANADIKLAVKELAGLIPASIRECVERAKLGMIGRQANSLAGVDIVTAAKSMKFHMALLNPKPAEPSVGDALALSLKQVVNGHDTHDTIKRIATQVADVHNSVC